MVGEPSSLGGTAPRAATLAPGRITQLLEELARIPAMEDEALAGVPSAGEALGRYELVREIGRGGFGVVYEARDAELDRLVALKLLRPSRRARLGLGTDALRREADVAAQLNHPNIATLFDAGRWRGGAFLVYELLEGETLRERMRRGALPAGEALGVAAPMAAAIAHAHRSGVLHQDLKPENVFLTADGRVKLLDFGVSRALGEHGAPGGTSGYAAPEQLRGEPVPASDVFSAGVVLFEALTGALPYPVTSGRSPALEAGPTPRPRAPGLPRRLASLVQRCLSRDPAARPRDGAALEDELLGLARAGERWPTRRRAAVGVAVAAALATAAAFLLLSGPGAPRGPVTVALVDAVNESGEPALDGLAQMLATSLGESPRLHVVPRDRLFALAARAGLGEPPRLDRTVMRAVVTDAGATVVLATTVRRLGDVYGVTVEGIDPRSLQPVLVEQERTASLSGAFDLVDRLAAKVQRDLVGAGGPRSRLRWATVTENLEAYRHLYAGLDCYDRVERSGRDCAVHLERALAADPGLALAHYWLAQVRDSDGTPVAERRRLLEPAVRLADRLPEKERALVLAWKAHLDGDEEGAMTAYRLLAARYPDDASLLYRAADLEFHRGNLAEASPWLERVLALSPEHGWALDHAVTAWGFLGDRPRLEALAARLQGGPRVPRLLHALSRARGWLGDTAGAIAAARAEADAEGPLAPGDLFLALARSGDLAGAEAVVREALAERPGDAWDLRFKLASLRAREGRWREARAELVAALAAAPSSREVVAVRIRGANLLVGARDLAAIRAAAEAIAQIDPLASASLSVALAYLGDAQRAAALAGGLGATSGTLRIEAAVAAWRRGDPAGAAPRLAVYAARPSAHGLPQEVPAYLESEALSDANLAEQALAAIRRFQGLHVWNFWSPWALPRSQLLAARSLAALGRTGEARAELDALIVTLRRADPDDPLAEEARALRHALGARSAATPP